MQDFIVVDIESTGINWHQDQMVSIGAVCSKTGDEFYGECRIYKWNRITETALKINGFTEEQCRDPKKQTPLQLYYKFRKWCEGRSKILAGHNLGSFDVQFLKLLEYKTKFNKWPFQYSYIDLHSVAFAKWGDSLSHKKICEKLGLEPQPAPHNALEGARSEMRCFKELMKKSEPIIYNGTSTITIPEINLFV